MRGEGKGDIIGGGVMSQTVIYVWRLGHLVIVYSLESKEQSVGYE